MAKNKDLKFANQYQIPIEVLQEGLPALLRHAPDDVLQDGNLIRVATAAGLTAALALQAPGTESLQAYVVYYIAPQQALLIATMMENAKSKPHATGGAVVVTPLSAPQAEAGAAIAIRPPFIIVNERVLEAKVLALMAIRGELIDIDVTAKQVREEKEAPYYTETQTPFVDHGLPGCKHLKPLKQAYFATRALSGHYNIAKAILKVIDRPLFRSLLKSFPMTEMEEQKHLLDLAAEYQEQDPQHKSLSLSEIAQQLLGLLAFLDFYDKKRLLTPIDLAAVSSDRSKVLKLLKRQRQKFRDLIEKQSLIGAECVDFQSL
ncbi:hypothetical protein PVAP13_5NG224848 [Panicum virgatum]|uniref:Uncharacterized protein n=1 Tax=Panicum virgatum TaxID=38727 RepID=A0A8T0RUK6_PANVG|nr:hypothetical protein PVAP13_5NG224848 [Panicum virgatum]